MKPNKKQIISALCASLKSQIPGPAARKTNAHVSRLRTVLSILAMVAASAQAETIGGWGISSLPYTITNSGLYHLTRNFNTYNRTNGAAITIKLKAGDNGDVVLDLNEHTITETNRQSNYYPYGIFNVGDTGDTESGRVTVRNGTLRGFAAGIFIVANQSVVENMTVIGEGEGLVKASGAIFLGGANAIIRNNRVSGCQTCIQVAGDDAVLENNRVSGAGYVGIYCEGNFPLVVNSRITSSGDFGIWIASATGKYRDNLVNASGMQYSGGTDAGNNH